ncbi:MAG: ribbon-helix-helix domain-containing protein [Candidatus Eremiobacteraeota bacterium]|nr:ribbon-helix-helix domain-containing protein [Candidatus Eremiobacteraeota bacterium]
MHRLQVQLTPDQEKRLRKLARLRKASISALIREGIDALVLSDTSSERERDRALAVVGKYSGPSNSDSHDAAFVQAIAGSKLPL